MCFFGRPRSNRPSKKPRDRTIHYTLTYVEFIELIHDKPHLSDDMRIAQLKMHVTGKAERTISGLGSQGKMYATALKTIKKQFGQPSVIARAYITKLIDKPKIQNSDRQRYKSYPLM